MVSEVRKQSMAWMETDYSKHTYFRWKITLRLRHLARQELWVRWPLKKKLKKKLTKNCVVPFLFIIFFSVSTSHIPSAEVTLPPIR